MAELAPQKWQHRLKAMLLTYGGELAAHPLVPSVMLKGAMNIVRRQQRPIIASINVVNRCNLNCAGCYWRKDEAKEERDELSVDESRQLILRLWDQGVRQFLLLGGEPMSKPEKVEILARYIAELHGTSTVITNGTYGLPEPGAWPRTHFMISCDGDRQGMDRVRGFDVMHQSSVFDQVKAVAAHRNDVCLAMTISKINMDRVEAFVKETVSWGIAGVVFSFATPNVGERQTFYLSDEQKELTVQLLLTLKAEYGDFIIMSKRAIELFRPTEVAKWSPRCPTYSAVSIRADGVALERCIFGPLGDCSRCGCNITTSVAALEEGDKETARFVTLPAMRAGIR
ncbi:MAG: hypothetical protein NVS4B11_18820 [Ktedonobacteraceae bacterium]